MQQVLFTTLNQMLVFFLIMILGFTLNKKKVIPDNADKILARLLADVIAPALTFETFYAKFNLETLSEKAYIFLWGAIILVVTAGIANLIARFFSKDNYVRYLYEYSLIVSNLAYLGYPLSLAVFGQEALINMMVFCIPYNIYILSVGVSKMNPKNKKISWRSFVTPPFVMMGLGMIFGIFHIPLPQFVSSAINSVSGCMGPFAMLLAGFVIAQYKLKDMFLNRRVYVVAMLRLIIIPAICIFVLKAIDIPSYVCNAAMCMLAMPMGLNTVVFPSAYGGDTAPGASMALISSLMSVITIPIIFAVFTA